MAIKLVGDKFPSVSCGHQRLECGARWELHNIVCRGRMASDLTTIFNRDQGGGAPNLFTPILGSFTVAELVQLCPLYGRGHLGWPPCEGSWRWSQEGGLVLIGGIWGRRRSRMRAQQGGARIYIFTESESFFSNGQSIFDYC